MTVESDLAGTADGTVRIPANVMGLLRQSYDSREKVLDWLLALGVTAALVVAYWPQLIHMCGRGDPTPDAGRDDPAVPSQDVADAFPTGRQRDLYTYNMPTSRSVRYGIAPSGNPVPGNPAAPPLFP